MHMRRLLVVLLYIGLYNVGLYAQTLHERSEDLPCFNKKFQIVAHVAVDSAFRAPIINPLEIDSLLERASTYFDPLCMSFERCEYDIIENDYTYNNILNLPIPVDIRFDKMDRLFAKDRRINIFFVSSIEDRYCGHGIHNGITTHENANIWVCLEDCLDPDPATNIAHQLGHLFGLYDTEEREEGLELVNGSNCETSGDKLCDTPADPYTERIIVEGELLYTSPLFYLRDCEFKYKGQDSNGEYYTPDTGNIMSVYPCKCGFTKEQYLKMAETYASSQVNQY